MRELVRAVDERRRGAGQELAGYVLDAAAGPPEAAERVLDGLAEATPRTWLRLDAALRSWWAYGRSGRYDTGALGTLVAACSGDGRRREEALARACMKTDRRLLPILVIRTADWVRPVRERAQDVLARALAEPPTLTAVGVALEMRDWSRGGHAVEVMSEALRNVPGARAATHRPTRRLAYDLWHENEALHEDVVRGALTETDPVSRLRCAEHVAQSQDVAALQRLLESKSVPVQVVALTELVKLGRPEHGLPFLTAGSSPLRATAQWAARRAGVDPAVRYREMDDAGARGRVAGLGECGAAEDLELIEPYLGHERPRVRAEAVRAFHRLGGSASRLAPMFTDPAPVVVRAVTRVLRGERVMPDRRLRLLLADPGRPRHVRRAALALSAARGSWPRVEADLLLLLSDDPELAAPARSDLGAWLRTEAARTYGVPSPERRRRVRELIEAAAPILGDDRARTVRWYLGLGR
ncbi:HEAT repeat domain-containing protein [Actinomadura sediminis]|uniref:HEAT repeat domain-containing protein n=1 Tax=Actinomadura sediminis TaxID=1038904 RepID=A0ABW3EJ47_9ACTN